jgi:U3 small nucleolar ribonucleoprotein component
MGGVEKSQTHRAVRRKKSKAKGQTLAEKREAQKYKPIPPLKKSSLEPVR